MTGESTTPWRGVIVSSHIAPEASASMREREELRAVAGVGFEGDRYAKGIGHFSHIEHPRRQATFFESEVLETLKRDHNADLKANECRMNLITRGVPLTHLVGREFTVGEAVFKGHKLNEPCKHLIDVLGRNLIPVLIHRCGLFAEILKGGVIRPGDVVAPR